MRAEQVPDRLRTLAVQLDAGPSHVAHIPDELREAAEALEAAAEPPAGIAGPYGSAAERQSVMRYADSARTQLEQADDLELDEEQPLDGPHPIARALRYAVDRGTLQGRAIDDLIDAVHVLNGSTGDEARELVEQQRAREAQAGLFDATDDSPAARRARGLEPIRPAPARREGPTS